MHLIRSDMFEGVEGKFDLIVANPPYIESDVIDGLQPEVKCQPRISLDGGKDGLDFYRALAAQAKDRLNAGGAIVMETGCDQAAAVTALFSDYKDVTVTKDLGGRDRVVTAFV